MNDVTFLYNYVGNIYLNLIFGIYDEQVFSNCKLVTKKNKF